MATLGVSDVHYYESTFAGAPVMSGLVSAAINVIKACLIDGFGAHTPQGSWEMPFTGTNQAVFKSTQGTQACLWLNDTAQVASCRGYETMTSILEASGTGPFPLSHLSVQVGKSATNNSTARRWKLYADSRAFYLFIASGEGTYGPEFAGGLAFGDYLSYRADDPYGVFLVGTRLFELYRLNYQSTSSVVARYASNAIGTRTMYRSVGGANTSQDVGRAGGKYPNYLDDFLQAVPLEIWDQDSTSRGIMPGILNPLSTPHDFVSYGVGYGRHYDAQGRRYDGQQTGPHLNRLLIDVTGPWR